MKDQEIHEAIDGFRAADKAFDEACEARERASNAFDAAEERLFKAVRAVQRSGDLAIKHAGEMLYIHIESDTDIRIGPINVVE